MTILLFWLIWPVVTFAVAHDKGRSGTGWAVLGLMFGPLALLFAAVMSPDREALARRRPPPPVAKPRRDLAACPACREPMPRAATQCGACGGTFAALPPQPSFWRDVRNALADRDE
jgi:hypothetical protein